MSVNTCLRRVHLAKELRTDKKRLNALRKAELTRKKAFGMDDLPQEVLDIVATSDAGAAGLKDSHTGAETRTVLKHIKRRYSNKPFGARLRSGVVQQRYSAPARGRSGSRQTARRNWRACSR